MDDRVTGVAAEKHVAAGDPRRALRDMAAAIRTGVVMALGGGLKVQLGIARRELNTLRHLRSGGALWPGAPKRDRNDHRASTAGSSGDGATAAQAGVRRPPERPTMVGPRAFRVGGAGGTKGVTAVAVAAGVTGGGLSAGGRPMRGGVITGGGAGDGCSPVMAAGTIAAPGKLKIAILSNTGGQGKLVENAAVLPAPAAATMIGMRTASGPGRGAGQGGGLPMKAGPGASAQALGRRGAAAYAPDRSRTASGGVPGAGAVGTGGGNVQGAKARERAVYGGAGPSAAGMAPEAAVLRRAGAANVPQGPSIATSVAAVGGGVLAAQSMTPATDGVTRPDGPNDAAGPTQGDVYLDGALMGRWMARSLAREAGRAPAGGSAFDARRNPLPAGRMIGG